MSNIGQGHRVKVPAKVQLCVVVVLYLRRHSSHLRPPGSAGLVVEGLTVDKLPTQGHPLLSIEEKHLFDGCRKILNVDVKCVKGTGAQNIGQGHRVKIPSESVHLGEALCKVWWLEVLHLLRVKEQQFAAIYIMDRVKEE